MTTELITVYPETGILQAAEVLLGNGYHTIPVLPEGRLAGIVGKDDILNTLIANSRVGEFLLKTLVIPAKAGHEVKLQRYPESD